MKYDSSMTQFHEDIVSAIKSMIHGDIDKVAELAAEASPVPLRDYLKEQYGRRCCVGNEFEGLSNAFRVKFDHMINNLGDTKLQLSWSQTTGFIRKYPSEFFSEEESADEILPDKNSLELLCNTFDESEIECPFWHTGQTMRYVNIGGVDFKCDYCDCSFCEFDKLTEFLASHCHDYEECIYYRKHKDDKSDFPCEDCGHDKRGCCDYPDTPDDYCVCGDKKIPASVQSEAAAPTDKYAEAVQLNAQIMTSAKAAQQNLYDMAMGFKKMRDDKLYKELGYDNFGDYCESETGMKRRSVYGYISVVENLPSDFVHSSAQIGVKKLSLLATLNEEHRAEIIENTDLESTTVKELREQIEQLKQSEAKTKSQLEHVNTVYEDMYNSCMRNKRLYDEQLDKNTALEHQLKELESRPRDVAVDTEELNRRLTEASAKLQKQAAEQVAEERRDFADKLNRMEEERDRLESRIAELESSENSTEQKDKEIAELKEQIEHLSNKKIKVFAVKLTVEEFERLLDIAKKSGDPVISNAVRSAQIIRI